MGLASTIALCLPLIQVAGNLPWERAFIKNEIPDLEDLMDPELLAKTIPTAQPVSESRPMARPGCTAADETIVVLGHLQGLSNGWKGFGVLAMDQDRLEKAAVGAEIMGADNVAGRLRVEAAALPAVRDEGAATAAVERLNAIWHETWDLGRRCGGGMTHSHEVMAKAEQLANEITAGNMTKDEAVAALSGEILADSN